MQKKAMELGANIKKVRKERRLTLSDIARETNIDVATLSRIENGKMTGTVQSHLAIAKVLGVHLPDLYDKAFELQAAKEIEAKPPSPVYAQTKGVTSELLAGQIMHKKMTAVRLTLEAGSQTVFEELPLGTERFVYCLTGKAVITFRGQTHEVTSGHSIYFNAAVQHCFDNPSKKDAVILILTTPAAY